MALTTKAGKNKEMRIIKYDECWQTKLIFLEGKSKLTRCIMSNNKSG